MTKVNKEREVGDEMYIEEEESFQTGKVLKTIVSHIYDSDFIRTKYKVKKGEELTKVKTLSKKQRDDLNAEGKWSRKVTLNLATIGGD